MNAARIMDMRRGVERKREEKSGVGRTPSLSRPGLAIFKVVRKNGLVGPFMLYVIVNR